MITVALHPLSSREYGLGTHSRPLNRHGCVCPSNFERKDHWDDRRNSMCHGFSFFSTAPDPQVEFDLHFTDTASIPLSTIVLFNYPVPGFAKLPFSLMISLGLFLSGVGGNLILVSLRTLIYSAHRLSSQLQNPRPGQNNISRVSRDDNQHTPHTYLSSFRDSFHHGLASPTC